MKTGTSSGFVIERRHSGTPKFVLVGETTANVTSYQDSGLSAVKVFYYRNAMKLGGENWGMDDTVHSNLALKPLFTTLNKIFTSIVAAVAIVVTMLFAASVSAQTVVIQYGDVWKYNVPSVDPGLSWRGLAFDDSSWNSGHGLLGFDDAILPKPGIRTVTGNAGSPQMTYLFRKTFNYDHPVEGATFAIDQIVDDGVTYYLNGNQIGSSFHTPGAWNNAATRFVGDAAEEFNAVTGAASGLQTGLNVLAAEVHQTGANNSDLAFGIRLRINKPPQNSAAWRLEHFGSTDLSGPGDDFADLDNDQVPNLVEYATGLDPSVGDASSGTLDIEGGNLVHTYLRRKMALNELAIISEWAPNPTGLWSTAGITEQVIADDGISQLVRLSLPHAGKTAAVIRTKVTRPPPPGDGILEMTAAQLRSGAAGMADAVVLLDREAGLYLYNASSTVNDDNAVVIIAGNRRYERVIDGIIKPEWWGAVGDEVADDYQALQDCINYAKISGFTVQLTQNYRFTQTLTYTQDTQFSAGLKMAGMGLDRTRLMPSGVIGPAIFLNGNTSGTNGHHMNDVLLSGFTITNDPLSSAITHGIEVRSLQNSTLENIKIKSLRGDGVRVIATTDLDTGACEVMTFKNMYIMQCSGWGFIATADQPYAVPLTLSTLDKVFVNTCGEGMYFQGLQMVKIHDCVSINATNYNLRFGRGTTPCHLVEIDQMELGNNFVGNGMPQAKMLSMEYIQHLRANRVRFINNDSEVASCGIEFGSQADSYLFDVEINEPWIVQTNTNSSMDAYRWLKFDPIVPVRENIRVKLPFFSALLKGKVTNDLSKVSYYQDDYSYQIVDFADQQAGFVNQSSVTPDLERKFYRVSINQTPPLNVTIHDPVPSAKYPAQKPRHGEKISFVVRNFAGLASLTFGSAYKVNNGALPAVGSHKVFTFKWDAAANEWYQM